MTAANFKIWDHAKIVWDWHKSLGERLGEWAELRRCQGDEVYFCQAYWRLLRDL